MITGVRKILDIGRQFNIHTATLGARLTFNLTGGPQTGKTSTEEHERKLCDHMLELPDMS
jgi:hypothetical protein